MRSDVLIIGPGPTGLVLALWLTRLGVKVRILDKPELATTSRALAVQAAPSNSTANATLPTRGRVLCSCSFVHALVEPTVTGAAVNAFVLAGQRFAQDWPTHAKDARGNSTGGSRRRHGGMKFENSSFQLLPKFRMRDVDQHLRHRRCDVETNCRHRCMAQSRIRSPSATMAPKCRWRSRPQHQKPTRTYDRFGPLSDMARLLPL
jgi:hypothetical protein